VLTRIPGPAAPGGPLPTVALTLTVTEPDATRQFAAVRAQRAAQPAEETPAPVAESHEDIYAEAMATIAALASNWSSAVQRTTGRHRAAA